MKIKDHGNWGHGLRDDETHDINCTSCQRELERAQLIADSKRKSEAARDERSDEHDTVCYLCGETVSTLDVESGNVAEMYDPESIELTSEIVHAECGISHGWEVS